MKAEKRLFRKSPPLLMIAIAFVVIGFFTAGAAASQKVVLVTGEIMNVDQARVKDGRVWITWNGLSLSIDQKDVLKIERNGKLQNIAQEKPSGSNPHTQQSHIPKHSPSQTTTEPSSKPKPKPLTQNISARKDEAKPKLDESGEKPMPQDLSPDAQKLMTYLDIDGFGDMAWGDNRKIHTGFKRMFGESGLPNVVEYTRPTDSLTLGQDSKQAVIKYAFWRDQFYMVTLWASGPNAFRSIKQAMIRKFGPGIQKQDKPQTLYWIDDEADRMIEYLEGEDLALLWMRSRDINHEYKLTQMRVPIRAGQAQ